MKEFLNKQALENLSTYQIENINSQIIDYLEINKLANNFVIDVCPKCGQVHPQVRKNGKTKAGKQMLECKDCHSRFVIDHGQLTYYSHQSQSKWNDVIADTIEGKSMKEVAAKINVHETTSFRMRHKFLHSLEKLVAPICLDQSN